MMKMVGVAEVLAVVTTRMITAIYSVLAMCQTFYMDFVA